MRPAVAAGLAAGAAVMCLVLLSAIPPGAGDEGLPESPPPPPPDPCGKPLLGSLHPLQCMPYEALGKEPVGSGSAKVASIQST